jgi:hypothetical protein
MAIEDRTKEQVKEYGGEQMKNQLLPIIIDMNRTLVAWFLHNQYLEEGNMIIRGTNAAKVGVYAIDADEQKEYYVNAVVQDFILFQYYRTTLTVTRGQPTPQRGGLYGTGLRGKFYFENDAVSGSAW